VFADVRGYGKSRHLGGSYSVEEVTADAFRLAGQLGWGRFHVVGHSMTGIVVQRMAVDDWTSDAKRLKSVVAITPVSADGDPGFQEAGQSRQCLSCAARECQLRRPDVRRRRLRLPRRRRVGPRRAITTRARALLGQRRQASSRFITQRTAGVRRVRL
jgi:pimeloyl-ACP methyl ester carboxylesterase